MTKSRSRSERPSSDPLRVWGTSLVDLGDSRLTLRAPVTVSLEDYGDDDYVASWPEIEAWGGGATEADAINRLKDEVVAIYDELSTTPDAKLGKLPRRWKRSLYAVVQASGGIAR